MVEHLPSDAIVDAERTGSGRLPWAWVVFSEETGATIARSEALFKTSAAAVRVGRCLQAQSGVQASVSRLH